MAHGLVVRGAGGPGGGRAGTERVDGLEAELVELTVRLEAVRSDLERWRITRDAVSEVLAGTEPPGPVAPESALEPELLVPAGDRVLSVPKWQPGMAVGVLPRGYRDILDVVMDAPGPLLSAYSRMWLSPDPPV